MYGFLRGPRYKDIWLAAGMTYWQVDMRCLHLLGTLSQLRYFRGLCLAIFRFGIPFRKFKNYHCFLPSSFNEHIELICVRIRKSTYQTSLDLSIWYCEIWNCEILNASKVVTSVFHISEMNILIWSVSIVVFRKEPFVCWS